jgi:hypothetical protein
MSAGCIGARSAEEGMPLLQELSLVRSDDRDDLPHLAPSVALRVGELDFVNPDLGGSAIPLDVDVRRLGAIG